MRRRKCKTLLALFTVGSLLVTSTGQSLCPLYAEESVDILAIYLDPQASKFKEKDWYMTLDLVKEESLQAIKKEQESIGKSITLEEVKEEIQRQMNMGLPVYVVQPGDHLDLLAQAIEIEVEDLADANQLSVGAELLVGDVLTGILPNSDQVLQEKWLENQSMEEERKADEDLTFPEQEELIEEVKETSDELSEEVAEETTIEEAHPTEPDPNEPVLFANEILHQEVLAHLKDPSNLWDASKALIHAEEHYQPTYEDMANLKTFRSILLYQDQDVADQSLMGLEAAQNLETIQISYSDVADYQALGNLKNLKSVQLSGNGLAEIDFLADLSQLQELNLSSNNIESLANLKNLTQLKHLTVDNNQLQDLEGLEKMDQLEYLYALDNQIENLKGIQPLSALKYLNVDHNRLTSIDDLGFKPNMEVLDLSQNTLDDLSLVAEMPKLRALFVISTKNITDLKPLENLVNLEALSIRDNQVSDIRPLSRLNQLKYLHLYENKIDNIEAISGLTELRELNISKNQVVDITPISDMQKLRVFFAYQNRVENLNPIVGLDNLRIANLSENSIYDLSGLITQMEAHNRQGYVVDRGTNSLIVDDYTISLEEDFVEIKMANPLKNIRNQFVVVDTSIRAEDGMYEGDPIQKAVDAYNQAIESLANQGVSIVSRTEVADNDTLVIRLSSEYFDQEGEAVSVQLPFFEREAISYDSFYSDFPEILDPILDGTFEDSPKREGESYALTNPFSGILELEFNKTQSVDGVLERSEISEETVVTSDSSMDYSEETVIDEVRDDEDITGFDMTEEVSAEEYVSEEILSVETEE